MTPRRQSSRRGSVVLVALCFVAIIGIALASYMAISSRALSLSNRNAQRNLSASLAELGLEEGLRAFNADTLISTDTTAALADWSSNGTSVDWTLDTANKRARASFTFPTGKFGQGATAAIRVRLDNYDAAQLDSTWNSSATYRAGNVVGYNGRWYISMSQQSNKTPGTATSYWLSEQANITYNGAPSTLFWRRGSNYYNGSMVIYRGSLYRATTNTSAVPDAGGAWVSVPYFSSGSDLQYTDNSILYYVNSSWYRYYGGWIGPLDGSDSWTTRWFYYSGTTYNNGDLVLSSTTWYRYINSTSTSGFALGNSTYWNTALTVANAVPTTYWGWNSSRIYNEGDVVYHSGTSRWYRCRLTHSGQTPSTTSTYWAVSPILSQAWDRTFQYSQNDTVFHNGLWYISSGNNNNQNPETNSGTWTSTKSTSTDYLWSSTGTYSSGDYRHYGGVWYRCLASNTGASPNNTSSWTPSWSNSRGVTTGAPVLYAQATVTLGDGSAPLRTQLRATLVPAPLFPNALGATGTLTLSGASTTITSYNSSTDPSASSPTDDAVLAAASTSDTYAVQLSGSNIVVRGYLAAAPGASSPYAPRASYATNAAVTQSNGSVVSASGSAPNVDLTRLSRSPYVPNFDIQTQPSFPSTLSAISSATTIGTPGAGATLSLNYSGSMTLDSSGKILTIVGPVVINIPNDFVISDSSAKIVITETGSLRLHVGGQIQIGGGGIDNQTLDPKRCVILGTATSGTHDFSTNNAFYGVIYLPNEDIEIDCTNGAIYGAVSARNITVSGTLGLRYDTTLRYTRIPGVNNPYMIGEWRELNPATEAATMP